MSFQQLNTPGRELAITTCTLDLAPKYLERVQKLGAMHPCFKSPTFRFTHQALTMLDQLSDFDTQQVLKEITSLSHNPAPAESIADSTNLLRRLWRCRYPYRNYHYLITFSRTNAGGITIEDVMFDENRTGLNVIPSQQRNLLYYLARETQERYRDVKSKDEAQKLKLAWKAPTPVNAIHTRHAAVNGMQNDLTKASWLMGTHVDVAYSQSDVQEYTLFHNPTDGIALSDVAECLWDKVAPLPFMASWQVRHLADLLWQQQMNGQQTDWVVHSQGAIIFKAAVRQHLTVRAGTKLDRHTVAFHAGGSVLASTKPYLEAAGIKIGLERVNPFDLVPNATGHNDLSPCGLLRALRFVRFIFGNNGENITISPHTLPYLGICTYYLQLKDGGYHRKAQVVHDYMGGLSDKQIAYEKSLHDPNVTKGSMKSIYPPPRHA
ncbi:MAG: hypothetical protein IPP19_10975 [Verrucomicrobia bacterium]|nr:hypothetical protein [Verrucomicrobiota bacterium]